MYMLSTVWFFRTELCRFSGSKIYPGRGIRFIRSDSQVSFYLNNHGKSLGFCILYPFLLFIYFWFGLVWLRRGCWFSCFCTEIDVCLLVWSIQVFLFVNSKCKRYFHNKLKPSKLTWTAMYRKQHKKVEYSVSFHYLVLMLQ